MKALTSLAWTLVLTAIAWWVVSHTGFGPVVNASLQAHWLDWIMGALCLCWLLIILIVPWNLYFKAHEVYFELGRAREHAIATPPGRVEYITRLRARLLGLALAAHLISAAFVAGVSYMTRGRVGYYFAVFYLVSTLFRPVVAGYVYLTRKLRAIGEEAHYPRADVVELRQRLDAQEEDMKGLKAFAERQTELMREETRQREEETRELRGQIGGMGREFESAVGRLTDNQEIIKGVQAFVRLISQSAQVS